VVRDSRLDVHGMLWDLALGDVSSLDRFEDVPRLYHKVTQPVISEKGIRRALVYVGRSSEQGRPRPGYLQDVLEAAQTAGLPAQALAQMRKYAEMRPAIKAPTSAAKEQNWVWKP
jgi:AIG2-like family